MCVRCNAYIYIERESARERERKRESVCEVYGIGMVKPVGAQYEIETPLVG